MKDFPFSPNALVPSTLGLCACGASGFGGSSIGYIEKMDFFVDGVKFGFDVSAKWISDEYVSSFGDPSIALFANGEFFGYRSSGKIPLNGIFDYGLTHVDMTPSMPVSGMNDFIEMFMPSSIFYADIEWDSSSTADAYSVNKCSDSEASNTVQIARINKRSEITITPSEGSEEYTLSCTGDAGRGFAESYTLTLTGVAPSDGTRAYVDALLTNGDDQSHVGVYENVFSGGRLELPSIGSLTFSGCPDLDGGETAEFTVSVDLPREHTNRLSRATSYFFVKSIRSTDGSVTSSDIESISVPLQPEAFSNFSASVSGSDTIVSFTNDGDGDTANLYISGEGQMVPSSFKSQSVSVSSGSNSITIPSLSDGWYRLCIRAERDGIEDESFEVYKLLKSGDFVAFCDGIPKPLSIKATPIGPLQASVVVSTYQEEDGINIYYGEGAVDYSSAEVSLSRSDWVGRKYSSIITFPSAGQYFIGVRCTYGSVEEVNEEVYCIVTVFDNDVEKPLNLSVTEVQ